MTDGVRAKLPKLTEIPAGTTVKFIYDQSLYIRQAIANLQKEGLLGAGLAGLMRCASKPATRPLACHAAWRTGPEAAVEVVLAVTGQRRTPEPLRRARTAARRASTPRRRRQSAAARHH